MVSCMVSRLCTLGIIQTRCVAASSPRFAMPQLVLDHDGMGSALMLGIIFWVFVSLCFVFVLIQVTRGFSFFRFMKSVYWV